MQLFWHVTHRCLKLLFVPSSVSLKSYVLLDLPGTLPLLDLSAWFQTLSVLLSHAQPDAKSIIISRCMRWDSETLETIPGTAISCLGH